MNKNLLTLIICCLALGGWAQQETETFKTAMQKFDTHFNEGNYEGIFNLYGEDMKGYLPLDKTTTFLSSLSTQLGKITKREFEGYVQSTYASYKTTFETKKPFTLNISLDKEGMINGMFIKPWIDKGGNKLERNSTEMILPFNGEWTVFWGGDTPEQNYHVDYEAQKGAFDILIVDEEGRSFKNKGEQNEDYYVFGKELIAPCDAEVLMAVDGIKDNVPGEMNPMLALGNSVLLKTANNEYLVFAHFKQGSVAVKEGQFVKQGDILGLCGNSGNSSEAHLHFHMQNVENINKAIGAKCFFDKILVNGEPKEDYSPVKGDKVSNP